MKKWTITPYIDSWVIMIIISVFQLAGKLVGVQNLTLEEDRKMQIVVTASNSRIVDGAEEEYPQG